MDRRESLTGAAASMQARGWKEKLAKRRAGEIAYDFGWVWEELGLKRE